MFCTLSHRWHTFKAIVLAKYLSEELHYESLESKSDNYAEKFLGRDGLEDYLSITSPFALHLVSAGKSELVRQCTIPRKSKAEAPVLPLVEPRQNVKSQKYSSAIGNRHGREGWEKLIAGESKTGHWSGRAC